MCIDHDLSSSSVDSTLSPAVSVLIMSISVTHYHVVVDLCCMT